MVVYSTRLDVSVFSIQQNSKEVRFNVRKSKGKQGKKASFLLPCLLYTLPAKMSSYLKRSGLNVGLLISNDLIKKKIPARFW